ncbi:hypothetical protein FOZ63_001409, partial [Perkinsus olseni]
MSFGQLHDYGLVYRIWAPRCGKIRPELSTEWTVLGSTGVCPDSALDRLHPHHKGSSEPGIDCGGRSGREL